MKNLFANLSIPKKLGLLAFALGFLGLFASDPYKNAVSTISTQELALMVENKVDHVTVDDLADWIIKTKSNFRLIDLNEEKDYKDYHIPGAENITLSTLNDGQLQHNEKIILYSNGGIHAAQAWMLLKTKGYKNVYTILGGLEEWKDQVLFPVIPDSIPAGQENHFSMLKERSKYFGGVPQAKNENTSGEKKTLNLPKLPSAGGAAMPAGGKKKKEGC